jgi:hypothetical protein
MNFYLSAVDAQLRREVDQPSIGLVLSKEKRTRSSWSMCSAI